MAFRKISFAPGEYYHIYNRGNSKQKIFHDIEDYRRFMGLLYACNSTNSFRIYSLNKGENLYDFERGEQLVGIGTYVLMPNHFHILITSTENGDLSKFMQKIVTAYVMYYNKKYKRTGGLFEGKFKAEHLDTDKYLKYIFSYIHLNPIKLIDKNWKETGITDKEKALRFLAGYKYSGYQTYSGEERRENIILNKKLFPKYFPTAQKFSKEILDWITYKDSQ